MDVTPRARGPWPHPLGDPGLSRASPWPGPSRSGPVVRVAVPYAPREIIVRSTGEVLGAGAEAGPVEELERLNEEGKSGRVGARYLVRPDGSCRSLRRFKVTESWKGRRGPGDLDSLPAVAADGSEWVYTARDGFCPFGDLPRRRYRWLTPTILPDGAAAVTVGETLRLGKLGSAEVRIFPLPPGETVPSSYDVPNIFFEDSTAPALAPDGTLYVQTVTHLARDSYDHTDLYAWRLFSLPPGGDSPELVSEKEVEDGPRSRRVAVSRGGHVIRPLTTYVEQLGKGSIYDHPSDVSFAVTEDRAYFLQSGIYSNVRAKPELAAIRLGSGKVAWSTRVELHRGAQLIADGENRVYHTRPGGLAARDRRGEILFEIEIGTVSALALGAERTLIVGGSDEEGPCVLLLREI